MLPQNRRFQIFEVPQEYEVDQGWSNLGGHDSMIFYVMLRKFKLERLYSTIYFKYYLMYSI